MQDLGGKEHRMASVIEFIKEVIVAAGGNALALLAVIKFIGPKIIEILEQKYENLQERRMEILKANLENKNYVTQKRYDKTFAIYEELMAAFCEAIDYLQRIIPKDGKIDYPDDFDEMARFIDENAIGLQDAYVSCKRLFYRYTPFIEEGKQDDYRSLLELIKKQVNVYKDLKEAGNVYRLTQEDFDRTKWIEDKYFLISKEVREYLLSLEIIN